MYYKWNGICTYFSQDTEPKDCAMSCISIIIVANNTNIRDVLSCINDYISVHIYTACSRARNKKDVKLEELKQI